MQQIGEVQRVQDRGSHASMVAWKSPPTGPRLLGRGRELETLSLALQEVPLGHAKALFIEGEAGIGKSRLLNESVAVVEPAFRVFRGHALELERDHPFGPVAEAFRPYGRKTHVPSVVNGGFSRLEHRSEVGADPYQPELRYHLVEGFVELVEELASTSPVLLALEDLHWADASTLLVIQQLIRRLQDLPIAVLATMRPLPRSIHLRGLLDALPAPCSIQIDIGPLDEEAVCELVKDLAGAPPGRRLLRQLSSAAGNPFFLCELLHSLLEEGNIVHTGETVDLVNSQLASSLRLTVLRRVGFLSDTALDSLRMAAVLGPEFSLDDLSVVLSIPSSSLIRTIREPMQSNLLTEVGERLAFRHELVRDAIYDDLPISVRKALHLQAARRLSSAGRPPSHVARHFYLGASPGDVEAIECVQQAAQEIASKEPSVSCELLKQAVDLARENPQMRDELTLDLASALIWSGKAAEAELELSALLERPHYPGLEARARTILGQVLLIQGKLTQSIQQFDQVRQKPGLSEADMAQVLADSAVAKLVATDLEGAEVDAQAALEAGQVFGSDPAVCGALTAQCWLANLGGQTEQALELGHRAVNIALSSTDRQTARRHPHLFLGMVLIDGDELDEGSRTIETGRRVAEELGTTWDLPIHHWGLSMGRYYAGNLDDAQAELQAGMKAVEEVGTRAGIVWAYGVLAHLAIQRDEFEQAERLLKAAEEEVHATGFQLGLEWLLWDRALLLEASGDDAEAAWMLQAAWDIAGLIGVFSPRRMMVSDLVRITLQGDKAETACCAYEELERAASGGKVPSAWAAALHCRGLVEQCPDTLLKAISSYRRSPRRLALASACEDAGTLLVSLERKREGSALLREAMSTYIACRATRGAGRVVSELRKLGEHHGTRGPRRRPATGWKALTRTELDVTKLAAEGLTNPQIGKRLFISRRTVETHLSHVFAKLGVSSRVELAAATARRAPRSDQSSLLSRSSVDKLG